MPADYKTKKWQHHGKAKAQPKVKAKAQAKVKAKDKAKVKDYELIVTGGHRGETVVFLRTTSQDKRFITQVQDSKAKFPVKVCYHVVETMMHMLETLPRGRKVADLPDHVLFRFRVIASSIRDKYIFDGKGDECYSDSE